MLHYHAPLIHKDITFKREIICISPNFINEKKLLHSLQICRSLFIQKRCQKIVDLLTFMITSKDWFYEHNQFFGIFVPELSKKLKNNK